MNQIHLYDEHSWEIDQNSCIHIILIIFLFRIWFGIANINKKIIGTKMFQKVEIRFVHDYATNYCKNEKITCIMASLIMSMCLDATWWFLIQYFLVAKEMRRWRIMCAVLNDLTTELRAISFLHNHTIITLIQQARFKLSLIFISDS